MAVAGGVAAAGAEAVGAVDSVVVRQVADFQEAGGLPPARVAAAVVLRVAAAATAGRHSVLPAADARAAASRVVARRSNPGRAPESELDSDLRSVQEVLDPELVSDSDRPQARAPVPASDSDRASGPGSRPDSGRLLCRVSAAERVWGVEIGPRTCPRRDKTASATCRIAWPAAIA